MAAPVQERAVREVVRTIRQNCRGCYTCVRDCPAKAIKIVDGQAAVVPERCIGCGNCTRVCSQSAKTYVSGVETVVELLDSGEPVVAMLAPSFPAEFVEVEAEQVVGALKALGFDLVIEVAAGADCVSVQYADFLRSHPEGPWIASACPAVVEFVRKYHPGLTDRIVPLVSPMVATSRAVHALYGAEHRCVFIGPCIAKKLEAHDPLLPAEVDEALTYPELRRLLDARGLSLAAAPPRTFDPPVAGASRVFSMLGGLLEATGIRHDLLDSCIVAVSGHKEAAEVFDDIESGELEPFLVEALMCHGCHCGPGMTAREHRHRSRARVASFVQRTRGGQTGKLQPASAATCACEAKLDLSRRFEPDDRRLAEPTPEDITSILARTNKFAVEDELNCGACGYSTCREKAIAVYWGLAEEAMCLPFMIEQAERVCHELKVPWRELRDVHRHLINTEKLASMGQLAAGVAHELNNPLGTILLYTDILGRKLGDRVDLDPSLVLLKDQAKRCKRIVSGLLDFARQNKVKLEGVRVLDLLEAAAQGAGSEEQLAERGLRIVVEASRSGLEAQVDRDQLGQVLTNLVSNGLEAMEGRGGVLTLKAEEQPEQGRILLTVRDEGAGIDPADRDRIFQPFFTTKSLGKGTGLGLPISYGIVKMHRGTIWFDSEPGQGTSFYVSLPKTPSGHRRSMLA